MIEQAREIQVLLPTNDKRRKQEKRQRGTTQEQPETRGMMTHDTLLVGYSLWYEGAGRDRSIYMRTHDDGTTQTGITTYRVPPVQQKFRSDGPQKKGGHLPVA